MNASGFRTGGRRWPITKNRGASFPSPKSVSPLISTAHALKISRRHARFRKESKESERKMCVEALTESNASWRSRVGGVACLFFCHLSKSQLSQSH